MKLLHTILILAFVMVTADSEAGRYRQPAYVTNAYFTNEIVQPRDNPQPDKIINIIRAANEQVKGYLVIDLLADKGTHEIEIGMLDVRGIKFDGHTFDPALAATDNFTISITMAFGGNLPRRGIFFKVYDNHERLGRKELGTFRIMTDIW